MIKQATSRAAGRALSLILAIAALGCRSPLDPVVLRFQGMDVRRSSFLRELEPLAKKGTETTDPSVRASAFGRFIEERVVAISAVNHGFREAEGNREEAERWLGSVMEPEKISEQEARAYYDLHPDIAAVPESITVREILLSTEQDARDVVRILASDGKAFELLARTRSRSPQAPNGGFLGSFRRGELPPEIERVAFALSPSQVSGIVSTSFGYHVLRLESKTLPSTRSFPASRPDIDLRLMESKARLRMKQLIDELVSQAQVNYDAVTAR